MFPLQAVTHLVSGSVSAGLAIWECVTTATIVPNDTLNDTAWCFLIAMSVFNTIIAVPSIYLGIKYLRQDTDQVALYISTGFSMWGIILCCRYSAILFQPELYALLIAEMTWFFTRITGTLIISCLTCKLPET